jgi:hypothetical protein
MMASAAPKHALRQRAPGSRDACGAVRGNARGRRAFLFSLDALFAALILVGGLVLISRISQHRTDTVQVSSAGEDTLAALSAIRISDLSDPWIAANIADGNISDRNITVLEQIGYFWANGQTDAANHLAQLLLDDQYPQYGARLTIDGTPIYQRNTTMDGKDVIVSSRMVSGIAQGKAITGSSAVAYLRHIKDKRTASFTTFGGFVGQGNITVRFADLPDDANISSIFLELAPGAPFTVSFNGIGCGGTRTASSYNGTPDTWDLSVCNESLVPGATNIVGINFSAPMNSSYAAGGYLRVKYKTEVPAETLNSTFAQYRFPGVDGILNLYDGFYVPGTLLNMSIYLHYNSSNSTYLDIGEKRVWEIADNGTARSIVLDDSYLRDPLGGRLDYGFLSNNTVPIRMSGFAQNITVVTSGDADVVVITDFSGSMKKAVADWDQGNLGSDCASAYADNDVRRTLLAQCVDNNLVDTVMNYSGNHVWPVFIYNDKAVWYNNPSNKAAIEGYINSYANGKGQTCYACALNLAHDILMNFSNSSRKKFVIFMSDGAPTHCASGSCNSYSTVQGSLQCAGMCDTSGACGQTDIPGACNACASSPGGQSNAYAAASRLKADLNATIYTVGFGPVDDCTFAGQTLSQLAYIGNGTYQHSNNSVRLKMIYDNISQEILTKTTLVSQYAAAVGPQARSQLFDDSYINITYSLAEQYLPTQNEISINLQSEDACNPVITLYPAQRITDAKAISYSGIHWSDYMAVNGVQVYNLSTFLLPYDQLGDPTVISAPISLFSQGNNTLVLQTGDGPQNRTGCFANNTAIYTVRVNLSTERSVVVPNATGCSWTVQFEDGTFENLTIPITYAGPERCSYTASNISYDPQDAYQLGAYTIFKRLDFKSDGRLYVNLRDEDLEVIVTTINRVPYLWGPSIVRLEMMR